jgi:hypothetical protein
LSLLRLKLTTIYEELDPLSNFQSHKCYSKIWGKHRQRWTCSFYHLDHLELQKDNSLVLLDHIHWWDTRKVVQWNISFLRNWTLNHQCI